jgi:hypothetical protein
LLASLLSIRSVGLCSETKFAEFIWWGKRISNYENKCMFDQRHTQISHRWIFESIGLFVRKGWVTIIVDAIYQKRSRSDHWKSSVT